MKIKFIHYKPYEYELLQEELDKLGKQGYSTNDLSIISFFRKKDKPVYYTIDFFNPTGSSKISQRTSHYHFIGQKEEQGLKYIYSKNNMYVFTSNEEKNFPFHHESKIDALSFKIRLSSLIYFIIALIISIMYLNYLLHASFDQFNSYGITTTYIGIIFLLITVLYRNFCNFYGISSFYKQIQSGQPHFQIKKLKFFRTLYSFLAILSFILVVGGLAEDTFNAKSFTPEQHAILQLNDFDIQKSTELSTQSYASFTIPHTYISLETAKQGNEALYIKEYQFNSSQRAQHIFEQIKSEPQLYGSNKIKEDHSCIYGYADNQLVSLVLLHKQSVIIVMPSFELSQENITIIQNYYK